jgi:hypothetical protein
LSYAMLGVRSAWWAFVFSLILRSFSPCQVGGNLNSFRSFKVFFLLLLYQTFFRCKNVYHKLSYAMLGVRSAWWAFVFSLILRSFSPCQVGGNLNSSSSLVNWMWKVRSCVNLSFFSCKDLFISRFLPTESNIWSFRVTCACLPWFNQKRSLGWVIGRSKTCKTDCSIAQLSK